MGATSELHIQLQDQMMNVIHRVKEGEITHLDALIALEENRKQLEMSLAIAKEFKDEYHEQIASEASECKYGYNGYQIEVRNGGKSCNYKGIPEWQDAEKSKKSVEAKYKSMWEAKVNGNPHANVSEDGEELPLPEITYRKSSIILKEQKP